MAIFSGTCSSVWWKLASQRVWPVARVEEMGLEAAPESGGDFAEFCWKNAEGKRMNVQHLCI
jgi:hypothetical protein